MTFTGKKLQDIYDSGSKELTELEQSTKRRLKEIGEKHSNEYKESETELSGKVERTASEQEAQIRAFMDHSLDRLKKVMTTETDETQQHIKFLIEEIQNLADKLKMSILELRKSHEENVHFLSDGLSDQYERSLEQGKIELSKHQNAATKRLRGHGSFVINNLQQKLDQCLWESRGEEKQVSGGLFKTYMQKASSIDTHFTSSMQQLNTDFQTNFKQLEARSQQGEGDVNIHAQKLLQDVDEWATKVEGELADYYKNALEQYSKTLDTNLRAMAEDLGSVHDSTTEKLNKQTKDLSQGLVTASGQAQENLKAKCGDVLFQVDSMMDSFISRLDTKVNVSMSLRQNLEDEKKNILEGIRKDLVEIRESVEKRLNKLMSEATHRVNSITQEAEHEIQNAQKRCEHKLKNDSANSKNEIEEAINKFVSLLAEHRMTALEEIEKSAGNPSSPSVAESKPPESPRQRRVQRRGRDLDSDS